MGVVLFYIFHFLNRPKKIKEKTNKQKKKKSFHRQIKTLYKISKKKKLAILIILINKTENISSINPVIKSNSNKIKTQQKKK
jgi:phosphoenolpyruvate-protein kinase (PTS system EI component)